MIAACNLATSRTSLITLFQRNIEAICSSEEEIIREVRDTVVHEVAHHFGIDDERLEEMGV